MYCRLPCNYITRLLAHCRGLLKTNRCIDHFGNEINDYLLIDFHFFFFFASFLKSVFFFTKIRCVWQPGFNFKTRYKCQNIKLSSSSKNEKCYAVSISKSDTKNVHKYLTILQLHGMTLLGFIFENSSDLENLPTIMIIIF